MDTECKLKQYSKTNNKFDYRKWKSMKYWKRPLNMQNDLAKPTI